MTRARSRRSPAGRSASFATGSPATADAAGERSFAAALRSAAEADRGRPPGRDRGRRRRRLRARRARGGGARRRAGGAAQRRQARRRAGPIRVYAEIDDARIEVFVRDRGPGFDLAAVPAGPSRRARVDRRQDGAGRRARRDPLEPRRRHRGRRSRSPAATPRRGSGDEPPSLPTVVIVDDHELFRAGVRAELEGLVEVRAEAGNVEEAASADVAREARRRPARRPHAGRRRGRGDPPGGAASGRRSASWPSPSPTRPRT